MDDATLTIGQLARQFGLNPSAIRYALIARAQEMRTWLLAATDCSCTSLDVCALFEPTPRAAPPLRVTQVGATR